MKREKIAVLKEGLLALTGNVNAAIILNQFIYWAECKAESDAMYAREIEAYEKEYGDVNFKPSFGWIYKSSVELADETMLGLSPASMRKFIKQLVDAGFLAERRNPKFKWDRTMQYNVNLKLIQQELQKIGFALSGYKFNIDDIAKKDDNSNMEDEKNENPFLKNKNQNSEFKNQNTKNSKAIPEITTKITKEDKEREYRENTQKNETHSLTQNYIDFFKPNQLTQKQMTEQEEYFAKFWNAYPRKSNKFKTRIEWNNIQCDVGLYEKILRSVELYKQSQQWRDANYIPYPENYLRNEKWEDDIPITVESEEMPF